MPLKSFIVGLFFSQKARAGPDGNHTPEDYGDAFEDAMQDLYISDGGSNDLDLDDIQTPVGHPRTFVTVATVVNPPVAGNAPCTKKNPPPKGKKGKSRAATGPLLGPINCSLAMF
jgi:hypothetical protein